MTDVSTRPHGGPATWWRLGLIATSIAAVAIGAVAVTGSGPEPDPSGAPGASTAPTSPTATPDEEPAPRRSAAASVAAENLPFGDQVVHEGDAVTAAGIVVKEPGAPTLLCRTLPRVAIAYAAGEEPPPGCSSLAVRLSGADESALPGWTERDGVWFTEETVTVAGEWRDAALAVGSVTVGGSPWGPELADSWQVPCAPPTGGWVDGDGVLSAGVEPEAYEAIMVALDAELTAHPDRYHGNWVGYPDGDPVDSDPPYGEIGEPMPAREVMIVSTVDDPAATQAGLETVFPGNLCVIQVERSALELEAVAGRFSLADDSWTLDADSLRSLVSNRVLLELPVLDEAAATRIGADAELVEVWSLVRPA